MTWSVPWVTSGVDEIPISLGRVLAYAATGGNEGIIDSNDLKVTAFGTPGSGVNVSEGAFVANNRFQANTSESYIGRNNATVSVTVTNTTSSARSDLVYAHVIDPGQPGQPATAGPVEVRVITNVAADVVSVSQVPALINQTGYALARIDRPSGASTVTNAQIVDLRQMAMRFTTSEVRSSALDYGGAIWGADLTRNSAVWSNFPTEGKYQLSVPSWANRAQISASITALGSKSTIASGELITYLSRITMSSVAPSATGGTTASTPALSQSNWALGAGGPTQGSFAYPVETTINSEIVIPAALRGTVAWFYFQAQQPSFPNSGIATRNGTTIALTVVFYARPE